VDDLSGFPDNIIRTKQAMPMSEREIYLMRMALIYAIANLGDVNDAFYEEGGDDTISVNGDIGPKANEEELDNLLNTLQ